MITCSTEKIFIPMHNTGYWTCKHIYRLLCFELFAVEAVQLFHDIYSEKILPKPQMNNATIKAISGHYSKDIHHYDLCIYLMIFMVEIALNYFFFNTETYYIVRNFRQAFTGIVKLKSVSAQTPTRLCLMSNWIPGHFRTWLYTCC